MNPKESDTHNSSEIAAKVKSEPVYSYLFLKYTALILFKVSKNRPTNIKISIYTQQ